MPKLGNLLKRRPEVPEDPELQERLVRRLEALGEPFASPTDKASQIEPDSASSLVVKDDADESTLDEVDPTALAEAYQSLFVGEPPRTDAVELIDAPVSPDAIELAEEPEPILAIGGPQPLAADQLAADVEPPSTARSLEAGSGLAVVDADEPTARIHEPVPSALVPPAEGLERMPVVDVPEHVATVEPVDAAEPEASAAADTSPPLHDRPERLGRFDLRRRFRKRVAVPIWTTPDEHLPIAADAAAVAAPEISVPARTRAGSKRSTARTPTPSVRARQTAGPATSAAPASSKPKAATSTARARSSRKSPGPTASALESVAAATPPPPALPSPAEPVPSARARPVRRTPIVAVGAKRPARAPKSMAGVVSCPYCAEALESAPVANVRCPRCRQRIVVRRVGDRFVYLTEAAVPIFIAQRRRAVHFGPWTRERDRWLALATASGAPAERIAKVTNDVLSEDVVRSARALYLATVERTAREARRDRRWEDASRVRFEQAQTVYRIARSPKPVPADVVQLHRDGLASTLRGLAEIAKSAELRAGTCCDVCRADDGRLVRIAEELRAPSLPHEDCLRGLCRCRWSLADRDRTIVSGLLRRHIRPARR